MKMGEKRKQKLYNAIDEPIMALRIALNKANAIDANVDYRIAQLTLQIWNNQKRVLRFNDIPTVDDSN